jgi:hypothetical protein
MRDERAHRKADPATANLVGGGRQLFRRDSYFLVFCMILATMISTAFLNGASWGLIVTLTLQTATLLLALRTSDAGPKPLRLAAMVAGLAVIGVSLAILTGNYEIARLAYGASMLALIVVTPVVIVRRLLSHPVVNISTITGAASIYLIFGLFWATVYAAIGDLARTGSQTAAEAFFIASRTPVGSDFVYYSYTTLSTVGYGDLTSSSQIGRMLSVSEALMGQLYLVIVVSLLVANLGRVRPVKAAVAEAAAEEAAAEGRPAEQNSTG